MQGCQFCFIPSGMAGISYSSLKNRTNWTISSRLESPPVLEIS
jgi:hypothetical protein